MKKLYGSKVKYGIPRLIKYSIVHATAESKCRLLNEHFATKRAQLLDDCPPLPELEVEPDDSLDSNSVTEVEVLTVMKESHISKASGLDDINSTLLTRTANNAVWQTIMSYSMDPPLAANFHMN